MDILACHVKAKAAWEHPSTSSHRRRWRLQQTEDTQVGAFLASAQAWALILACYLGRKHNLHGRSQAIVEMCTNLRFRTAAKKCRASKHDRLVKLGDWATVKLAGQVRARHTAHNDGAVESKGRNDSPVQAEESSHEQALRVLCRQEKRQLSYRASDKQECISRENAS